MKLAAPQNVAPSKGTIGLDWDSLNGSLFYHATFIDTKGNIALETETPKNNIDLVDAYKTGKLKELDVYSVKLAGDDGAEIGAETEVKFKMDAGIVTVNPSPASSNPQPTQQKGNPMPGPGPTTTPAQPARPTTGRADDVDRLIASFEKVGVKVDTMGTNIGSKLESINTSLGSKLDTVIGIQHSTVTTATMRTDENVQTLLQRSDTAQRMTWGEIFTRVGIVGLMVGLAGLFYWIYTKTTPNDRLPELMASGHKLGLGGSPGAPIGGWVMTTTVGTNGVTNVVVAPAGLFQPSITHNNTGNGIDSSVNTIQINVNSSAPAYASVPYELVKAKAAPMEFVGTNNVIQTSPAQSLPVNPKPETVPVPENVQTNELHNAPLTPPREDDAVGAVGCMYPTYATYPMTEVYYSGGYVDNIYYRPGWYHRNTFPGFCLARGSVRTFNGQRFGTPGRFGFNEKPSGSWNGGHSSDNHFGGNTGHFPGNSGQFGGNSSHGGGHGSGGHR